MRQGVIAAISTPPGKGGVAIIRISGEGSFDLIHEIFEPISKKSLGDYPPRTQVYGHIKCGGEKVDDGMVTLFPCPNSYTGEDTVEISCHGGILITRTILEELFARGANPAEPGEFTRRAFINGKLTLTGAEAVGRLLEAQSREQIRLSAEPARARLNAAVASLRSSITELLGSMYARIDYPDEDLGDFTDEEILEILEGIKDRLSKLIATYRTGRAITEGISAVICGKPNVGKSTLYNLLLGEDAAIVTDIAGTTRDLLESKVSLGRVMLRLTDTAGIRHGEDIDRVEKIGIERSEKKIESAALVIALFDLSRPFDTEDEELLERLQGSDAEKIYILNKSDAESADSPRARIEALGGVCISVSASEDPESVISAMEKIVDRLFTDEKISSSEDAIISSARQHAALLRCLGFIDSAIEGFRLGIGADAASSDIERALGAIAELDGREVSDEVVADIFSRFCVGK